VEGVRVVEVAGEVVGEGGEVEAVREVWQEAENGLIFCNSKNCPICCWWEQPYCKTAGKVSFMQM